MDNNSIIKKEALYRVSFFFIIHSVVKISPATEAAFSNAVLVTFAGSNTPAAIRFSYDSVLALKPNSLGDCFTFSITKSAFISPFSQI